MKILESLDYYVLRTSVLPIEDAFDFIDTDENLLLQFVKDKISDSFIESSFFIASPDFNTGLKRYLKSNKTITPDEKIVKSFYKYFVRMSSRCTPFGLFAGCALGKFSNETKIKFESEKLKSISRLDMYYVSALSEHLNKVPFIREQLLFFPNETLYANGSNYRYIEFSTIGSSRSYKISGFNGNNLVRELLESSQSGISYSNLIDTLLNKDFEKVEVEKYIQNLIESQILVSDLLPSITGDEYFSTLIQRLKKLGQTSEIVADLESVDQIVKSGQWTEKKNNIVKEKLTKYIHANTKNIVQTDLFYDTKVNTIRKSVIKEINELIEECIELNAKEAPLSFSQFINKFELKYGDREIPLLLALDNENGIGYKIADASSTTYMPLVEGIQLSKNIYSNNVDWDSDKGRKLQIILDALQNGITSVDLKKDNKERNQKKKSNYKLPDSMFMFGSVLAKSEEELDSGKFEFLLNGIGGPSAANLLARFCHGDEILESKVKESLQQEAGRNKDYIYAEIVHLPDGRTGNVIMRPTLRNYEIPILTKSSVDNDHTIKLSDLLVSVNRGEVILRSKKLNKRIIPRLTNAHNYTNGLPIYKFLCDLQHQGLSRLSFWDWSVFGSQPFLPRIQYGKIILSRATWNLSKNEFLKGVEKETSLEYFTKLKAKYRIPDKVALIEGDNELLLNLNSQLSVNILSDKIKKRDVKIQEYLFSPENCFVKDNKGSYANELIIPLISNQEVELSGVEKLPVVLLKSKGVKRNFNVSEEWLYFKIFTGHKTADKVLVEAIKPLAEELLLEGVIEKWFFIRYYENGPHIRVRFYNSKQQDFWSKVIQRLHQYFAPFEETGLIDKIQIDTYQREIERYGNSTMELSEQLFFYDSIAITEFLELIDGDQGEEYRWLFALLNIDSLLDDFRLTLHEKFQLISQIREYFYEETNSGSTSKRLWVSLNNKFRKHSKAIFDILERNSSEKEDVSEAVFCFKRRSDRNNMIVNEILAVFKLASAKGDISLISFLSSHIHMTLNRTFIAKQRIHETVIYHLLAKYYDSKISRLEKSRFRKNEPTKIEKS